MYKLHLYYVNKLDNNKGGNKDMTFKEMIHKGLCDGVVKVIQNPNDDCISCQIGQFWFYFIGSEDENLTPDEVYESYTKENLADMIYSTLKDMEKNNFADVDYCKGYLEEYYKNNPEVFDINKLLWNELLNHRGHNVEIVTYGDYNNPVDVCLECKDCNEIILDAEIYTLCAREDH